MATHIRSTHMPDPVGPSTAPPEYHRSDSDRLDYLARMFRITWIDPDSEMLHAIFSPSIDMRAGDTVRTWIDRQLLAADRRSVR